MAIRVSLLGGFELRSEGHLIELPTNARRVLAFLALKERSVSRVYVAGVLWPDATEQRSLGNLRTAVWRLRTPSRAYVVSNSRHLRIADDIEIDVRTVIQAAQKAIDRPDDDGSVRDFGGAGELLPDWYDDWVEDERERIRQMQLYALEAVAVTAFEHDRYAYAAEACLLAIHLDGLRETPQRLLLQVHLAEGNRSDARRQYLRYLQHLRSENGLEPSIEMQTLARSL